VATYLLKDEHGLKDGNGNAPPAGLYSLEEVHYGVAHLRHTLTGEIVPLSTDALARNFTKEAE
jgi:hypothetical protein